MRKSVTLLAVLGLVLGLCSSGPAWAAYPDKPITFVVPFSAGGGSDVMARAIAKVFQDEKLLPQPLVVENRPGGSGAVGYAYVARRVGDPYIIATVSSSFWTTPLTAESPVNHEDFTPISGLGLDPFLLMVNPKSPYKTLEEIIKAAKEKPMGLTVGGTSLSDDRVCTGLLEKAAGIKFNYVPFEGGGEAMTALLGGHVDLCWANPGEALNQLEAGRAAVLAVSVEERLAQLPDVPTFSEAGYPQVVHYQLRGIVAPKNVPEEAVKVLEAAFKKLHESQAWQKDYMERFMVTPRYYNAKDFANAIVERNNAYTVVYKEIGVLK